MTYLLDTDWVVDHLAGRSEAVDLVATLAPDGIAISIITYVEVFEGILGGRDPRQAERVLRQFLEGVDVIGISRTVARRAAAIRVGLRRRRVPIDHRAMDLLIAATAVEHDLTLVSRNTRDYGDIPVLRLYQPT